MDPLLLSSLLLATISFDCAKSKECAFVQEKFGIVYMTSNFWQLAVGSRDLSQAEKKYVIVCKAGKVHKMTTTFTKNVPRLSF